MNELLQINEVAEVVLDKINCVVIGLQHLLSK